MSATKEPKSISDQVEHWLKNIQLRPRDEAKFVRFLTVISDSELAQQAAKCVTLSLSRKCFDTRKMQLIWDEVIRRTTQ